MKCIFCFGNGAKIHFDKKFRPYYYCSWCSHRIFFHSPMAYKAVLAWAETAKAITQEQFSQMLTNMNTSEAVQHTEVQKWIQEREKEDNTVVCTHVSNAEQNI